MNSPSLLLALRFSACLSMAVLASCHSPTTHAKRDPHEPLKWNERISKQTGDMNKVAGFNKVVKPTDIGDRGTAEVFTGQAYGTSAYKGNTQFKGAKDYKTKDFSGAGKPNRAQNQLSSMGTKKDRDGSKTFGTKDSRWATKTAQGNDKTFHGATSQYKTGEFEPGSKSIEKNKRPYFLPAKDLDKTKTYAEQDVKALLNRN